MQKKIKICFLIPQLSIGGAEINVVKLSSYLLNNGFLITVLYEGENDEGALRAKFSRGIKFQKLAYKSNWISALTYINYLKQINADILIATTYFSAIRLLMARLFSKNKCKIILWASTHFSTFIHFSHSWKEKFFLKVYGGIFLNLADKIIAMCEPQAEDMHASLKIAHSRIDTIYSPVIETKYKFVDTKSINQPWLMEKNRPFKVIIMVGRLTADKCIVEFLEIFKQAAQSEELKLVILGEGELEKEIKETIRSLALESKVAMIGFQSNHLDYIASADLYVVNSRVEGLNNIIIESLSCGTTVISRDCPVGPGFILGKNDCGRLVEMGDNKMMLDVIIEEVRDPSNFTYEMQKRSEDFTVEQAGIKFEETFNSIL